MKDTTGAMKPHNKSGKSDLALCHDYKQWSDEDAETGKEPSDPTSKVARQMAFWLDLTRHKDRVKMADTDLIPGSPCIMTVAQDGRVSHQGLKPYWGYQIVALLKYGYDSLVRVSSSKSEPGALTISHLCGAPWCLNPDHLLLEPKTINDERTACHRGILVGVTNGQSVSHFLPHCPHTPPCCGVMKEEAQVVQYVPAVPIVIGALAPLAVGPSGTENWSRLGTAAFSIVAPHHVDGPVLEAGVRRSGGLIVQAFSELKKAVRSYVLDGKVFVARRDQLAAKK